MAADVVSKLGAVPVRCSLGDVDARHVEGCEVVAHCAAQAREWAPPGAYYETNVIGTKRLLEAARRSGVRRFIHISTDSVLLAGAPLRAVSELSPLPETTPYDYAATKAEGELTVIAANDPPMFETVAIRPCLVWGPGDTTILPEIREMVAKGQFLWLGGGKQTISTTNINNLTAGIQLAMTQPCAGEVFYITDEEPVQMRAFLSGYLGANGVDLPGRSVPTKVAAMAAWTIEWIWRRFWPGQKPPLTRLAVELLSLDHYISTDKARRILGYQPEVTIASGLEAIRTVAL
jgi:nucleoside-diphosphate-sugar epimerase